MKIFILTIINLIVILEMGCVSMQNIKQFENYDFIMLGKGEGSIKTNNLKNESLCYINKRQIISINFIAKFDRNLELFIKIASMPLFSYSLSIKM